MARPKKQTVDYFPLYVNDSRTLRIVRRQFGNDGFAFWVTMLQILGRSEGHFFDYNSRDDWLDLVTQTYVMEEQAEEILAMLATLGMIDKELYDKKIIWVQHFVDEHVALYARRRVPLPIRPGTDGLPLSAVPIAQISGDDRTIKELPEAEEDGLKVTSMISCYEDELGRVLTPMDLDKLKDFADTYPDGWFEKAVEEVKGSKEPIKAPMRYIEKCLLNWEKESQPDESLEAEGDWK